MNSSRATLQDLFDQAIALHQQGELAGAERLYQQVLLMEPASFAPRHMLGVVRFQQGRNAEAIELIAAALKLNPQVAAAWVNLGNVQAAAGRPEEAVASYRRALVLSPGDATVLNALAGTAWSLGHKDEALERMNQLLAAQPGDIGARHHRGNMLRELKRPDEALADYDAVLAARPDLAETWSNRGAALSEMGRAGEAVESLDRALALAPGLVAALNNRGFTLRELARFDEALENLDRALALQPDYAPALANRGKVLSEINRLEESFQAFRQAAELAYRGAAPEEKKLPHQARHDREQREWLAAQGDVGSARIIGGERLAGRAVNAQNQAAAAQAWHSSEPKIVVIDDLLTAEALESLRRYCLGSDIWHTAYTQGYLGAFPESGFAAPLLAQVAEELSATFREIFASFPLRYHWAFKYDSKLDGIGIHADEAAVNVNFWITPDGANRNPEGGGLVIWDKAAPLEWDFAKFNADESAAYDFLAKNSAKSVRVPYLANRAVIFDSNLFHKTDAIDFAEGYENRRINITMLYGRRRR
ncbi:MAG TPA: tetratricopeptide repeat protein, partial [Rhizomicrobium sp.]|nr:tetratricopeptide repeat protein [Rhizomicrobium sp.]